MTWPRVVQRNGLGGDYDSTPHGAIAGDLRRLERDSRDPLHLAAYAKVAGITEGQARAVLDAFFAGDATRALDWDEYSGRYELTAWAERAAVGRDDTKEG
jgi:hypothetical protein